MSSARASSSLRPPSPHLRGRGGNEEHERDEAPSHGVMAATWTTLAVRNGAQVATASQAGEAVATNIKSAKSMGASTTSLGVEIGKPAGAKAQSVQRTVTVSR